MTQHYAYFNRGLAYKAKGDYESAIRDFMRAIEVNSSEVIYYTSRSWAYYYKSQHDLALKDFKEALEIEQDNADAYNGIGACFEAKGFYELAIKNYSKVLVIEPSNPFGYFTYYTLLGLKGKAVSDPDGWITTTKLYNFVKDKVADATNNVQIPALRPEKEIRIGKIKKSKQ